MRYPQKPTRQYVGIAIEPLCTLENSMGKILSFTKKKKSVKKSSSYLEYMKAIIASHREGKILQFPMSKVINRTYGKKF